MFSSFRFSSDCPRSLAFILALVAGLTTFVVDLLISRNDVSVKHLAHLGADILISFALTGLFTLALVRWMLRERTRYERDLEAANRRLRQMAITDSLTGVYNHRYFEMKLEKEWARMRRLGHPLTCVMIDIDNFKSINDTYGHAGGDAVLAQLARILMREFREIDIVSRYGGEEFTIILIEKPSHIHGLAVVMERIRKKIATSRFEYAGKRIPVTVSLGGALAPYHATLTKPVDLVVAADSAMYTAKQAGKNCARVWTEK